MLKELIEAVASCKDENEFGQIYDLVKGTRASAKAVTEAIEASMAQGFKIGKKVKLIGDTEIGEIVKFNLSTIGFYTGDEFPIVVKFERGTFEYKSEGLVLIT